MDAIALFLAFLALLMLWRANRARNRDRDAIERRWAEFTRRVWELERAVEELRKTRIEPASPNAIPSEVEAPAPTAARKVMLESEVAPPIHAATPPPETSEKLGTPNADAVPANSSPQLP